MTQHPTDYLIVFDRVMREPETQRGMNIEATLELLGGAARELSSRHGKPEDVVMNALVLIYSDAFVHTRSLSEDFNRRFNELSTPYLRES